MTRLPTSLQDVIPSRVQERETGRGILSVFCFTSGGKSYTIIFALRAVDMPARMSLSLQRQFFAPAFYCAQYVYCSEKPFRRKAIETPQLTNQSEPSPPVFQKPSSRKAIETGRCWTGATGRSASVPKSHSVERQLRRRHVDDAPRKQPGKLFRKAKRQLRHLELFANRAVGVNDTFLKAIEPKGN